MPKFTKKFKAAATGLALTYAGTVLTDGHPFGPVERAVLASSLLALVPAYAKKNDDTPGGVPTN